MKKILSMVLCFLLLASFAFAAELGSGGKGSPNKRPDWVGEGSTDKGPVLKGGSGDDDLGSHGVIEGNDDTGTSGSGGDDDDQPDGPDNQEKVFVPL